MNNFIQKLCFLGYERFEQVENIGQFAVRGGIIDFFSPAYTFPIRIELFGNKIDSISSFDIDSQRRENILESSTITPCTETLVCNKESLVDKINRLYKGYK